MGLDSEYIEWPDLLPNKVILTFTDGREDFQTDGARFRIYRMAGSIAE